MKIEKYKYLGHGKYKISIDNREHIIYEDVILKYSILGKESITQKELDKLKEEKDKEITSLKKEIQEKKSRIETLEQEKVKLINTLNEDSQQIQDNKDNQELSLLKSDSSFI